MTEKHRKQKSIKSITAITEVFSEGQKVTAVAIEYDKNIGNSKLSKSIFSVEGRTITGVYANTAPSRASKGTNGRFVIIELSTRDKEASTINEKVQGDRLLTRKETKVRVTQTGEIITTDGEKYPPDSNVVVSDKEINLIVDDFLKLEYRDLKTGERLKYNLFIPKGYDRNKSYPMVVFISDRGVVGERHDMPLIQSLGGVIWATPSEQAKHECFVLVPQYPSQIVFDNYTTSVHFDITVDLINSIVNQYNIDTNRLYATGQSMGCMSFLEMSIRYPDMFAAMLLVSGFWNPRTVSVLAHNKMWVIVSEGDGHPSPDGRHSLITTDCMASLEAAGAKISRAHWDGRQSEKEAASRVGQMIEEGNNVKYTVYKDGTFVTPFDDIEKIMNHEMYSHVHTWKLVYAIEAIRDWLFAQVKRPSPEG